MDVGDCSGWILVFWDNHHRLQHQVAEVVQELLKQKRQPRGFLQKIIKSSIEKTQKARNLDYHRNHQHRPRHIDQETDPTQQEPQEQDPGSYIHYQHVHLLQNEQPHGEAVNSYQTEALRSQILGQTIDHGKQRRAMGMKSAGGEIVQVQGGHIVRSTGRKDRHSKVYTAKGPRDRRVRLSAHTAIQFYDVQDRLGYDRPSKAVDWLIKKAKSAIDKLAELPPWHPTGTSSATATEQPDPNAGSADMAIAEQSESSGYNFQLHRQLTENPDENSNFIPSSLDSEPIPDNMKCLFPTTSATSSINFQTYPPDIISRTSNHAQDLGLSLHSFQDHPAPNDQNLFAVSAPVAFDANYQRMLAWQSNTGPENRGGFVFNPPALAQQALLGQGSPFSQRGPLQSSFAQSVRAWDDLTIASSHHHKTQPIHHSTMFGSRFASDGLSGFCIPPSIQGGEEQSASRPSSTSPNSHH